MKGPEIEEKTGKYNWQIKWSVRDGQNHGWVIQHIRRWDQATRQGEKLEKRRTEYWEAWRATPTGQGWYLVDPEKWNLISDSVRPADSHFAECVAQARLEYSCGCVTSRHVEVTAEYYGDTFREIVER